MITEAARVQAVLEGVSLPATTRELIAYAAGQPGGAEALPFLSRLGKREFRSLDEVGEALAPVQPHPPAPKPVPRAESGEPPGGGDYTNPSPEPGAVRVG